MSLIIEDLARDRVRQIQRETERIRYIRRAKASAKTAEEESARGHHHLSR